MSDLAGVQATIEEYKSRQEEFLQMYADVTRPLFAERPAIEEYLTLILQVAKCNGQVSGLLLLLRNENDLEATFQQIEQQVASLSEDMARLGAEVKNGHR